MSEQCNLCAQRGVRSDHSQQIHFMDDQVKEIESLKSRLKVAEVTLMKYGHHNSGCKDYVVPNSCQCGLEQAISKIRGEK